LCAAAGQGAYVSAKFAVRGFTETLRQEMVLAGNGVKVTLVHPGGVKTGLARNSTGVPGFDKATSIEVFDKAAMTSPQQAASAILAGVRRNKARVLVGLDARALDLLVRLTGPGYLRLFTAFTAFRVRGLARAAARDST
jgi:short-subunit dehydrogenase